MKIEIVWDGRARGWRVRRDGVAGLELYASSWEARRAEGLPYWGREEAPRSESSDGRAEASGVGGKGLVSCQQSSVNFVETKRQREERANDRLKPGSLSVKARSDDRRRERERERRWSVALSNGSEVIAVDSKAARVRRCQKRVVAWAAALKSGSRRERRYASKRRTGPRTVMITLTYKDVEAWQPNHIRDFMIAMRRVCGGGLYGYAWVLETQQRGAPHYHVLLYVKRGTLIPKPDESGLWPHGSTKIETARTLFYICKYAGKEYQKEKLPHGARMFAVQIYKHVLSGAELLPFRLSSAPGWLQDDLIEAAILVGSDLKWRRFKGGGWLVVQTGQVFSSGWSLVSVSAC